MKNTKLIIHEKYQGVHKPEDIFSTVLLSSKALTTNVMQSIMTKSACSQGLLYSEEETSYETSGQ